MATVQWISVLHDDDKQLVFQHTPATAVLFHAWRYLMWWDELWREQEGWPPGWTPPGFDEAIVEAQWTRRSAGLIRGEGQEA